MSFENENNPARNLMRNFLHCEKCLNECPSTHSPREYAALEVGFTRFGIQVWCKRHELNVMHMDFQGQKHPACFDESPNEYE